MFIHIIIIIVIVIIITIIIVFVTIITKSTIVNIILPSSSSSLSLSLSVLVAKPQLVTPVLQGYGCFCSPCVAQPPSAAASAFGGLRVSGFAVILTVIPSLIVVAILLVCFYTIRKHRSNSSIPNAIAYSELHIGTHSEVLGEGAHGLILKGTFCGVAVSVKRLLAPSNPAYPSAFDFEVDSKKSLDFGAGAAYLARTQSSTAQMQASPSPNRAQRRRNSFLELVFDNLQVQLSLRVCMLCPVKTTQTTLTLHTASLPSE